MKFRGHFILFFSTAFFFFIVGSKAAFSPNPALQGNPAGLCGDCVESHFISVTAPVAWRQVVWFAVLALVLDRWKTWSVPAAWLALRRPKKSREAVLVSTFVAAEICGFRFGRLLQRKQLQQTWGAYWKWMVEHFFCHSAGFGVKMREKKTESDGCLSVAVLSVGWICHLEMIARNLGYSTKEVLNLHAKYMQCLKPQPQADLPKKAQSRHEVNGAHKNKWLRAFAHLLLNTKHVH